MSISRGPLFFIARSGFYGVGLFRWYLHLQDTARHRLLFSQRNQLGYRRLLRSGAWQLGIRWNSGR